MDDGFTGDTLAAPATALASESTPRTAYTPRAEDFAADHPEAPGMAVSFNTLVMTTVPSATVGQVNALLKSLNAELVGSIPGEAGETPGILFLRLPTEDHAAMDSVLAVLRSDPLVAHAVQDVGIGGTDTPTITADANWTWSLPPGDGNWGMEQIRAPQMWNLNGAVRKAIANGAASGSRVVVVDVGFTNSHEDLVMQNLDPSESDDHGVHVAGIIGARWDNDKGVNGLDPFVDLVVSASSINVFDRDVTWAKALADELERVIRDFAPRVVNVSMGFNWYKTKPKTDMTTSAWAQSTASASGGIVHTMLSSLESQGVRLPVITASAGNDSGEADIAPVQPALYSSPLTNASLEHGAKNIIVVEATDASDQRWIGSNVGGQVSAPGHEIYSTSIPHDSFPGLYEAKSGTSMAAPHVAGLVSYLYALAPDLPRPTLSSNPMLDLLASTGAAAFGARGRIDAFAAAMDLDRVRSDTRVLRMLVDMDDGSEDGNLRVDPETGADVLDTDLDNDGGEGDGSVDMADFRTWRDAFLSANPPGTGVSLDGSASHPKKDLNRNGTIDPTKDDEIFPRADLNGDGSVDNLLWVDVGGAVGATVRDLDVLTELFDDPHYSALRLEELLYSGDVAIWPQFVLGDPDVQSVRSYVYRASDDVLVEQRVHTGSGRGEGEHQVYTLPVDTISGSTDYRLRLEAVDRGATVVFTDTLTVTLRTGQDEFWNPLCTVDDQGAFTGGSGTGSLCTDVVVSPRFAFVLSGEQTQFTVTTKGVLDPSVTWSVGGGGSINSSGLYTGPGLAPGESTVDTVVVTSVEDAQAVDTALVIVSQPRIQDQGSGPCTPSATDDCARTGKSWGDPHLLTPDGYGYDFMASGDFILAKSTEPGDDFEVQLRFIEPAEDETFSWNSGAAMRVEGNVVEILVDQSGDMTALINGDPTLIDAGFVDLNGGSLTTAQYPKIVVSWPDGSQLVAIPSGVPDVISEIRLTVSAERAGKLEGLFGDFDGDPANDLRVRGGAVLDGPSAPELYNEFRQSWWVRFGTTESLFSTGAELFNPQFPPRLISISDLEVDEVGHGQAVCTDAGVLDRDVLRGCILDVVLTGDDSWALVSAGVDPNTLGMQVSPAAAFLAPGDERDFGAIVSGTDDRRVEWSVTGGSVTPVGDNRMTYTAPTEPGTYTITATLVADGVVSTATVQVTGAPSGYSKVWNGSLNNDWTRPENWTPAGVPDSTDNVYVPADAESALRILSSGYVVNDLRIEEGSIWGGGTRRITARGDAHVDSEWIDLVMTGLDKTVQGRMYSLWIHGSSRLVDDLRVDRDLRLMSGGTLVVGPHLVEAEQLFVPAATGGGRLIMRDPAGRVVVQRAEMERMISEEGTLTAGTFEVQNGSFELALDASMFISTGEHRILMSGDGSAAANFSLACPRCLDRVNPPPEWRLNDVEFANPAGVRIVGQMPFRVDGVVSVTAGTVDGTGAFLNLFGAVVDDVGGWNAGLVLRSPTVVLPTRVGGDLQVGHEREGGSLQMALPGDLEVGGALTVMNGSTLSLGGSTLVVEGALRTRMDANLVMDSEADTLVAFGAVEFGQNALGGASTGALFSAGVFDVRGDFRDNFFHFTSSGTNVVRFSGSAAQTVDFYCLGCVWDPADARRLQDVEITNPVGVTFVDYTAAMAGSLSVAADAVATFETDVRVDQSLDLAGALTVSAASTVTVGDTLFLRSTAVLNNEGVVTPGQCQTETGYTVTGTDPCGS